MVCYENPRKAKWFHEDLDKGMLMLHSLERPPFVTVLDCSELQKVTKDGVDGIFVIGDAWDWLWEEGTTNEVESGNDREEKCQRKAFGCLLIQTDEER